MNKNLNVVLSIISLSTLFLSNAYALESADFGDDTFDGTPSYQESYSQNDSYDQNDSVNGMQIAENTQQGNQPFYHERSQSSDKKKTKHKKSSGSYTSRLPQTLDGYNEKVIIVNPRKHVWGAYSADGKLLRAGLATAGSSWCPDIHRACRTRSGSFRIQSLGSRSCYSKRYPVGRGGAPMPYCMFFNGNQGLHGSHELAEANLSHGCVRISVSDAEWVRFNFANIGTKVVVTSY